MQVIDDIHEKRNFVVAKSNYIIQDTHFDLSLSEIKSLAYIISKIKPDDDELKEYIIEIKEYCEMIGIDSQSGQAYRHIKESLKNLSDKSFWAKINNGKTTRLYRWITNVDIEEKGYIKVRMNQELKQELIALNITGNYTQYKLINILPMKSKYGCRLFELLTSYSFKKKSFEKSFEILNLKKILQCEHYGRFADFRKNVLEVAVENINTYSDLIVEFIPIKKMRITSTIIFKVVKKDMLQICTSHNTGNQFLDKNIIKKV